MLKRATILCAFFSAFLLTAASFEVLPDHLTAPVYFALVDGDDTTAPADCDKGLSGDPDLCDPGDRTTACTAKGSNATCQNCPANTNEATRKDPDGDGCCCDWGASPEPVD